MKIYKCTNEKLVFPLELIGVRYWRDIILNIFLRYLSIIYASHI